ncbi:hypothetical protein [Kitasatospora sp. SUK 42]|uniref:hypothetical protein n=1 Tax=Kitasatospora sp. SUK 42 TaxID=1588882 RepID=UPI001C315786|nr:hypothetical protein [Kitasatospora sp. SUK 42]MBV2154957.1 hypothetical protein [Kitasatospora sp. SUK 42]
MYSARPGGGRYHPVLERLAVPTSGSVALLTGGLLALGLGGLGELHSGWLAFAAYLALCGLLGGFSRPGAAPVIGLAAWLCCNAFAEHRHAELGWAGPWPEGGHFAAFTATALLVSLPTALPRRTVRVALLRFDRTA